MISWTVVLAFFVALAIGLWFGFKLGCDATWAYIVQQLQKARARRDN